MEEAYRVYGVYDFVVKVRAANVEELKEIIVHHLRRLEKVLSTTTMIVTDKLVTKREMVIPA